ncbi:MAG: hypothetical protein SO542_08140 [Muribaculaceae bacterium]|nr:hypothetical protein [Muribaculaceae bacterium]MDY4650537.1 hypothetical protein [Muribaculaceae bacterium]
MHKLNPRPQHRLRPPFRISGHLLKLIYGYIYRCVRLLKEIEYVRQSPFLHRWSYVYGEVWTAG